MFQRIYDYIFHRNFPHPSSKDDMFLLTCKTPYKDFDKVKLAKRRGYKGVKLMFAGIPGVASPEDQADAFERAFLIPNNMKIVMSSYKPYMALIDVEF